MLFDQRNERDEYIEFAATFLELRAFAPDLLRRYFPTLESEVDRLAAILLRDIDAEALWHATRPAMRGRHPAWSWSVRGSKAGGG